MNVYRPAQARHWKESLRDIARAQGASVAPALEEEGADPKLSTLLKLAEALGVKPWELLPGWQEAGGRQGKTNKRKSTKSSQLH